MTNRLVIGIDPGQSGALALLADGEFAGFRDMPTIPRKAGGEEVSGAQLAAILRGCQTPHLGAYVVAVIEKVGAMPGQGVSSAFRFGQSDGVVRGALGACGIGFIEVAPVKWKNRFALVGQDKDAARAYVIKRFPGAAVELVRKRDGGRADALLIALWAHETEQIARAA